MKILITRFSSIGDIVLTTPVIRSLRHHFEHAEIHYATKKEYASILEHNPYIDKVHQLDDSLLSLISSLRQEKFDLVIDLHKSLRSRILRFALGKKYHSFPKLNFQKWLLVRFKINRLPNVHIVDRYFEAVKSLNVKPDSSGLDYFIPDKDEVEIDWLPEAHQMGYVALVIGAKHNTKKLPVNRLIELCDKINKPIILLGDELDLETGQEIEDFFNHEIDKDDAHTLRKELNKKAVIFNACGKFNLNQSASILKQARYVFTHDTGLMHIAAAFRKHIFSIWGSSLPEFGMYPYRTKFSIFERKDLYCRPCSKIGFNQCPKGHFRCMNELKFDFYLPD